MGQISVNGAWTCRKAPDEPTLADLDAYLAGSYDQ